MAKKTTKKSASSSASSDSSAEQSTATAEPRKKVVRKRVVVRKSEGDGPTESGPGAATSSEDSSRAQREQREERAARSDRPDRGDRDDYMDRRDRPDRNNRHSGRNQHRQPGGGGGHPGHHAQGGPKKRKKKNRKGMPSGSASISVAAHQLPSDNDLERDAAGIRERLSEKEYAKAAAESTKVGDLQRMPIDELHAFATEHGFEDFHQLPRHDLIFQLLQRMGEEQEVMFGSGTLEIAKEGFGFLRSPEFSYLAGPDDIYVSPSTIRRYGLRKGMEIEGAVRPPKQGEKFFALLTVDAVNGQDPSTIKQLPIFEDLTPLHPFERYVLEIDPGTIETRIVDLVAPIGRGQRALIVAPPRTGKTVLMQKITQAISTNYPETKILVLLIDERPEEVTDFRRNTADEVEVIASTFDEDSARHVQVAEMVMEKARRYVEFGEHVVILLDSITRLARAYNANQPTSGKIMSGGIDSNALTRPKKFFGSARAIENGGSLTILGTALVDTGSRADEVIFEEFKGTGNSELHLDRKLIEKRIYPAIDIAASGTRREELLMDPKELELVYRLRKVLSDMNVVEAMELLKGKMKKTKTNAEFLMTMSM
ncbi:MAG: transcription termination factor Rho [Phycisphaerales bacterium]